ncbi:hypothetical protein TSACC_21733 [Terrimicrobium sacchariphilum]|uniref:Uncharacterized protein n=1 Tax=Terrimicrobium sacchariphilum TaxID=690879 RepID=A0A146G6D7_TERSA|nr:hypothetical protein [Terrimicrobium sacchariphilum]GAT33319.1 hypothetical protein TSACC_21733 [Terrimicrobium sacchariphilum]
MQDDLGNLLKSWQPDVPETSDFRRKVWSRIEQTPSVQRRRPILEWLVRPRVAWAMVAVALVLGGFAGAATAERTDSATYLRSVNPYARLR